MAPRRQPSARYLAAVALAIFAVALIVVVASSLSGDGGTSEPVQVPAPQTRTGSTPARSGEVASEYYVVRPGDNLVRISARTGLSVQELQRLNPDLDPQALVSGQRVRLAR
jgi:LysM repeat protein